MQLKSLSFEAAQAVGKGLPILEIVKNDQYFDITGNAGALLTISLDDVIALIPLQDPEYLLLSMVTKDTSTNPPSETYGYKAHRIIAPPAEFSKFILSKTLPPFLDTQQPDALPGLELSIIVSTQSGTCWASLFWEAVVEPIFNLIGLKPENYTTIITESSQTITEFTLSNLQQKARESVAQSILLLSGDGGITDIVSTLYRGFAPTQYVPPRIGLLALGTGNALANSSGINQDSTKGLRNILFGEPQTLPAFVCRCSPGTQILVDDDFEFLRNIDMTGCGLVRGVVVASWALHATLVAESDTREYRKFGAKRFQMVANDLMKPPDGTGPHQWKGKITVERLSGTGIPEKMVLEGEKHSYVLAAMVSHLEADLNISPHSKPFDGQLRLLRFPPLAFEELQSIFKMAYEGGNHINHDAVEYLPIEQLRIDIDEEDGRWRRICIDGRIVRLPEAGWVEIKREARIVAELIAPRLSRSESFNRP